MSYPCPLPRDPRHPPSPVLPLLLQLQTGSGTEDTRRVWKGAVPIPRPRHCAACYYVGVCAWVKDSQSRKPSRVLEVDAHLGPPDKSLGKDA